MSALALRVSAWQNATPTQRRVLRLAQQALQLGQPARYQTGGGQHWFIFDDLRFTLRDAAVIGRLVDLLADFDGDLSGKTDEEVKAIAWDAIKGSIVLPKDVAYDEAQDPWQQTLDANSAPAFVQWRGSVPDGLTPVTG